MSNSRMQHRLPHKGLRTALAVVLSLSMVLGGVPVPAVQAIADEFDGTPIEEPTGEPTEGEGAAGDQLPQGNAQDPQEGAPGDGQGEGEGDEQDGEGQSADGEGNEQSADGEGDEQPADGDDNGNEKPADGEGKKDDAPRAPGGPLKSPSTNPNANNKITTVDNNDYGIVMNLFDYNARDNQDNKYGQAKGTDDSNSINYQKGSGNSGERNYLQFYGCGTLAGEANTTPGINNFAGYGSWSSNPSQNGYRYQYAMQGIVQRELSGNSTTDYADRYPQLNTNAADKSLNYLFDPSMQGNAMTAYTGVNHFFYDEDGYLSFNSNEHYAYYDTNTSRNPDKNFTIYQDTYLRNSAGNDGGLPIGFFPFDAFNQGASRPGAVINPTNNQCGTTIVTSTIIWVCP